MRTSSRLLRGLLLFSLLSSYNVSAQDGGIDGPASSPESAGYSCDPTQCQLPSCHCASTTPPGGLSPVRTSRVFMAPRGACPMHKLRLNTSGACTNAAACGRRILRYRGRSLFFQFSSSRHCTHKQGVLLYRASYSAITACAMSIFETNKSLRWPLYRPCCQFQSLPNLALGNQLYLIPLPFHTRARS
jgi:hypothetical protein